MSDCGCKKNRPAGEPAPDAPTPASAEPERPGACPSCLRKHLVKARGYGAELAVGAGGEWERERLLENLLLAEDHAEAAGARDVEAAVRAARLAFEAGADALSCAENALAAGRPLFPNPHT